MCADAMAILIRPRAPVCGGGFKMTSTAVALLLYSMENSIVLMGLKALFSDWLHPIITTNQIAVYLKHMGLF